MRCSRRSLFRRSVRSSDCSARSWLESPPTELVRGGETELCALLPAECVPLHTHRHRHAHSRTNIGVTPFPGSGLVFLPNLLNITNEQSEAPADLSYLCTLSVRQRNSTASSSYCFLGGFLPVIFGLRRITSSVDAQLSESWIYG